MFKSRFQTMVFLVPLAFVPALPGIPAPFQERMMSASADSASANVLPAEESANLLPPDSAGVSVLPVPDRVLERLESPALNRILDRAIRYQEIADSLERKTVAWRIEAGGMDDPVSRGRLQKRIERVEDSVTTFRRMADEQFNLIPSALPEEGENKKVQRHPFLIEDTVRNGITVYRYNLTGEFRARMESIGEMPDSDEEDESSRPGPPANDTDAPASPATPSFSVLDSSPYGPGNPFERDFPLPPGVFYRIQLAVYSKEIDPGHFGGLFPITTEAVPGKDLTRYFVGKFKRIAEARTALIKVRSMGYPDAFVVGYFNGQKGSFSKLKALEK